jgi:radical SAM superfamily enzyme YgiQ (UPF0313 family)
MNLNKSSIQSKFKKVCIVSSGQVTPTKVPAALAFLAGVCEKNDIDYEVIDLNVEFLHQQGQEVWDKFSSYSRGNPNQTPADLTEIFSKFLDKIVSQIQQSQADCIAITLLSTWQHHWALRFLTMVKEHLPEITTIAGGPGISAEQFFDIEKTQSFGRYLVELDILDYYVMGEGDVVMDNFLLGNFDQLGLNTKHTLESWQPQIDNLDTIPMPSYKKIKLDNYTFHRSTPQLTITGSRGCVRRCTFCDVGHHWKKFKFHSGQWIADEILKHHLHTGATEFYFSDSLINGSLKQFYNFLETIHNYQQQYPSLKSLRYEGHFIIRPKSDHTERMYQLMQQTGCKYIVPGVESGSETVRNHMGKKFSNADIDYHLEMCEKHGIQNWFLMMCSYPTETTKDFQDTLDSATKWQKYLINDTIVGCSIIAPTFIIPNTPLHAMVDELQIEFLGHEVENYTPPSFMYESKLNPELTVIEKNRRFIEASRHFLKLGYRVDATLLSSLSMCQEMVLEVLERSKDNPKKSWTIIPSPESIYS